MMIKTSPEKFERIIRAAIAVFAEKGFHNAKVADVAKAADVADGTIYLYFKNKDDLIISIFENCMDFLLKQAREKLAGLPTVAQKIHGFVELHLKSVQKNPELAQVLQVELRGFGKFMKGYKTAKFFEYLKCLEEIIANGQTQGVLKTKFPAHLLARSLFGAIDEMALEWVLMKKKKYPLSETVELIAETFWEGARSQPIFTKETV